MKSNLKGKNNRSAFSLVELVVVVLIIGILAAVAAPRMFDTAGNARDAATKASLGIVRDAIELFRTQTGNYPATATLANDLKPYMKGAFPSVQATTATNKTNTVVASSGDPMAVVTGTAGWVYNATTGDFAVNHASCNTW